LGSSDALKITSGGHSRVVSETRIEGAILAYTQVLYEKSGTMAR